MPAKSYGANLSNRGNHARTAPIGVGRCRIPACPGGGRSVSRPARSGSPVQTKNTPKIVLHTSTVGFKLEVMSTTCGITASQRAYLRELENANALIRSRDAVMTADDGFQWVDTSKLPEEFMEYYCGLKSAGYAKGYI